MSLPERASLPDRAEPHEDGGWLAVLRVPLFLIALGGLFLIADYGGPDVSRTWPALLVVLGLSMVVAWRRSQ